MEAIASRLEAIATTSKNLLATRTQVGELVPQWHVAGDERHVSDPGKDVVDGSLDHS